MKRVAIYARVSTDWQEVETQLLPLRMWVSSRDDQQIEAECVDIGLSGSTTRRPGLDKLMQMAYRKECDVIVVQRFDRFARSVKHLVTALDEFRALGIDFVSLNESVDTSTPMGRMVFTVLAAVAELEKSIIRERVMAGLDRARRQGKILGPPRKIFDREKIRQLRAEGQSLRQLARGAGVSKDTIRKAL